MDAASVVIAGVSAVIACVGAAIAWQARGDSNRAVKAAEAAEHRASRPRLLVEPEGDVQWDATDVIYRVHNLDGPDLASVLVHRPAVAPGDGGGVIYPVAVTGHSDYGDRAEIGPIPIAEYRRFTLKVGVAPELPEFRVRVTCTALGTEPWELGETLTTPRGPAQLEARRETLRALAQRQSDEDEARDREALEVARRVTYHLRGGAGIGTGTAGWQMTTLHVDVRNDSDVTVSDVRVIVGDGAYEWASPHPLPPGGVLRDEADLQSALPDAPQSESGGRAFKSYASRLEFTLGGRRYSRTGDELPSVASPS